MVAYIIGLILAIALIAVLFFVFFWSIVSLIVNIGLLYLIAMRMYEKYRQHDVFHYAVGLAASALLILLFGNIFPFWKITNIAVLGAIIAEVIYWFPKVNATRKRKKRKR